MAATRVLILANSIKKQPLRCIAGRVISDGKTGYEIGSWIRPVSPVGEEGALSISDITLQDGTVPEVFDFVDIQMGAPSGVKSQPENCLILPKSWISVTNEYQRPPHRLLVEGPSDLWLESSSKTDRVTESFLTGNPPLQSLYCIRPGQLELHFYTAEIFGKRKKRHRAFFTYNGTEYDLSLTDLEAQSRHCEQIPALGSPKKIVALDAKKTLLCISLTGKFQGCHYKLAAAVLEET